MRTRPALRPTSGSDRLWALFVVGGLLVEFLLLARLRLVDADEGWELMAARLVASGARIYFDFFSQQMPVLPWLYGAWARLAGSGWGAGRLFTALLAAGSGLLVFRIAARRSGDARWGALAAALFGFNALLFSWLPCVKTYALTTLLLLLAWESLAGGAGTWWSWLLAGGCAGLAVGTRLFVVAAVPLLLLAGRPVRRRGLALFAAGFLVAILPMAGLWREDPARLWYMNMGYHLTRSDLAPVAAVKQKVETGLDVAGLGLGGGAAGSQVLLLLVTAAACAWRVRRFPAPFAVALVLGFVSLLPTPTYAQYFCVPVPFLILGVVELVAASPDRARGSLWTALAAAYLLAAPVEWHRVVHSGEGLPSVDRAPNWSLRTMERVGAVVDQQLERPGEPVLSWWPGYLACTSASAVPGLENQFALSAGRRLPAAVHDAWHVIDPPAIERMIRSGRPRVCIVGSWMLDMERAPVRALLAAGGYRVIATIHDIEIWKHR